MHCRLEAPKCHLHAWLGSSHDDHAQSDALMQVPLLHGGRHADDAHEQQRGVLEVLGCHLRRPVPSPAAPPGSAPARRPGAQPRQGARASLSPSPHRKTHSQPEAGPTRSRDMRAIKIANCFTSI